MQLADLFQPEFLLAAGGTAVLLASGAIIALSYIDDPDRERRRSKSER